MVRLTSQASPSMGQASSTLMKMEFCLHRGVLSSYDWACKLTSKKIYIDGGFADNSLYIQILAHHFPLYPIYTTQSSLGSSLGAAMIMQGEKQMRIF